MDDGTDAMTDAARALAAAGRQGENGEQRSISGARSEFATLSGKLRSAVARVSQKVFRAAGGPELVGFGKLAVVLFLRPTYGPTEQLH